MDYVDSWIVLIQHYIDTVSHWSPGTARENGATVTANEGAGGRQLLPSYPSIPGVASDSHGTYLLAHVVLSSSYVLLGACCTQCCGRASCSYINTTASLLLLYDLLPTIHTTTGKSINPTLETCRLFSNARIYPVACLIAVLPLSSPSERVRRVPKWAAGTTPCRTCH